MCWRKERDSQTARPSGRRLPLFSLFEQPNAKGCTTKRKTPRFPKANDPFFVLKEVRLISMPQARCPLKSPPTTMKFVVDLSQIARLGRETWQSRHLSPESAPKSGVGNRTPTHNEFCNQGVCALTVSYPRYLSSIKGFHNFASTRINSLVSFFLEGRAKLSDFSEICLLVRLRCDPDQSFFR